MTINLDSEIVASRFNAAERTCTYTIRRDGRQWTVTAPLEHFDAHGGNKMGRRNHLAKLLEQAMRGPPDPEQAPDAA